MQMNLSDFLDGNAALPRIWAQEQLALMEVAMVQGAASNGGKESTKFIDSVSKRYQQLAMSPAEKKMVRELEKKKELWKERGLALEITL